MRETLSIQLNRLSRERKWSERDHGIRFEKNARVLKIDLGSLAIAGQALR
jgi:hypothetical protein